MFENDYAREQKRYIKSMKDNGKREPFVKIDGINYSQSQIRGMSLADLTSLNTMCDRAIESCMEQRDIVRERLRENGDDIILKSKVTNLNHAISKLKDGKSWIVAERKKKKLMQKMTETQMFKDAAHHILDKDTYYSIIVRAQAMADTISKGEQNV